jgi:uncharacterized RDD family membrane protein YckC
MTAASAAAGGAGRGRPEAATHHAEAAAAQAAALARVHPAPPAAAGADYAGLVTRALAFGIDAVAVSVVGAGVGAIVGLALSLLSVPSGIRGVLAALAGGAFLVWTIVYFVAFWSTTGQTPGNRLMRIRVIPAHGSGRLPPRRGIVRLAAMTLAAIPLFAGFLLVLVDDRRRGLHDIIARTLVVYAPTGSEPERHDDMP